MNILLIGGGGREHALAWKLKQAPRVKKVYCTPGNAGIMRICEPVDAKPDDFRALAAFVRAKGVVFTVVGPEAPLCAGIVNEFQNHGLKIFGPDFRGARLEGSKVYAKQFMQKYKIPTAASACFTDKDKALAYLKQHGAPVVVKADGLASGKGVFVCATLAEAEHAIQVCMADKVFGDAGRQIVVEDMLKGEEASILALTDGKTIVPLESSQDHKRVFDRDQGPNTGGMGAYSPAPVVTPSLMREIETTVLQPVLKGLQAEKIEYHGVIYAGLMIDQGRLNVLEFNVRFGDPETQAVLPRLKTDFADVCLATIEGRLGALPLTWDPRPAVCVVMASGGYPGTCHKHLPIAGLDDAAALKDVTVFHAGTTMVQNQVVTDGGRVLGVTALGGDVATAIARAYEAVEKIHFEHAHFRWDIGARAIKG